MGNLIYNMNIGNVIEMTKLHNYYVGIISEHYLNNALLNNILYYMAE